MALPDHTETRCPGRIARKDFPLTADPTLTDLGWTPAFAAQLDPQDPPHAVPARLSAVHRDRLTGLTATGPRDLTLPTGNATRTSTGEYAVGDWVLADPDTGLVLRRLDRTTLLQRAGAGETGDQQLIAANIDTLFVTTSCNADFNPARLERYLALAHGAGVTPVILLTKSDTCDDPESYRQQAEALGRGLTALSLNAKSAEAVAQLAPWCGPGQTVALAGSSGVGKTTLTNALTGGVGATREIREDDARGRHTTTGRSLHPLPSGGWLIDTPGMRSLALGDVATGIDATFEEISSLLGQCRFRDCKHEAEPGCALQAALAAGDITPDRFARWTKLHAEDSAHRDHQIASRARAKPTSRKFRAAKAEITGRKKS